MDFIEDDANALLPILVTLLGISIEVNLSQSLNVSYPISVTPSGIVIEVSDQQLANASSPR